MGGRGPCGEIRRQEKLDRAGELGGKAGPFSCAGKAEEKCALGLDKRVSAWYTPINLLGK